ncbi:S-adenosylmethionine decarboxylase proenzyme [Oceanirhabdus seepicola]|uniref:S-adenosylmethionine decarboxylase proenzyme n=1 Tax=Oceanirhabdus seepicola TaxID=2828781 RepID=A0A9J6P2N0_9CLOT|nr:S-adenosylmethionine decarboxylase proenzyme [Oceanirhabdus seepicola]
MNIQQLGRHILVEMYNCDKEILNNHKLIEGYMNEAAEKSGATIVQSVFHMFNPWGVSGAVIIQESHLTIHTWPEYGYAAIDLFTCGDSVDPWIGLDYLKTMLKSNKIEIKDIIRGETSKIRYFSNERFQNMHFKPINLEENND